MNPITNSCIKEEMRQKYYIVAERREMDINNSLNNQCAMIQNDADNRIRNIQYQNKPSVEALVWLIIGMGIFGVIFNIGFLVGAVVGVAIYGIDILSVKNNNSNKDKLKIKIKEEADNKMKELGRIANCKIRDAYDEADRRTLNDIKQYDAEVKRNYEAMIKKTSVFVPMVDHSVNMFQRMVSHADSASNRKFVETDFIFKVELYGICYKYQSTYSNPKDDFNFDRERYRNLNTREECEGLAQAIAKMTISKMKSLYPPNSLNITLSHNDAEVTLHFKAANKNYVPPRNIY